MFADELECNASRRRQEENRARRRKLKQEQQQQNLQGKSPLQPPSPSSSAELDAANTVSSADLLSSNPSATASTLAVSRSVPSSTASTASSTINNKDLSAIEMANLQRLQRHQVQSQRNACMKIQSFYRMHRSNSIALEAQRALLTKRLQDLSTLELLMQKQGSAAPYIPPPATATALCLQMLFLTKSLPYSKRRNERNCHTYVVKLRKPSQDCKLLHELMKLVLLRGVASSDENINPMAVWIQSVEGRMRIQQILRLALVVATTAAADVQYALCLEFVCKVVTSNSNDKVILAMIQYCRPLVLSVEPPVTLQPVSSESCNDIASMDTPMDLISILRHHLLYAVGGAPIPASSDKMRESCIPVKQREHANALFQTVLTIILGQGTLSNQLLVRFVSSIFTVPLLTWKVSGSSIDMLITCSRDIHKSRRDQPFLVTLLEVFIDHYEAVLNAGEIETVICQDLSLTKCCATPSQILLSNLIQLGRISPQLNASQLSKLDFEAASVYFRFLATLVDSVPLSTFSSRESVVEWIDDGKGHHSPVVLSPVILEHCRMLVSDAWLRRLFRCAMDVDYLQTEKVLSKKTERDLKLEKELAEVAASSATSLAAKEAKTDRSRAFWKSSVWARKLTKRMGSMLSMTPEDQNSTVPETSGLINATATSRKLASEGCGTPVLSPSESGSLHTSQSTRPEYYNPCLLRSLSGLYGIVLARWGGGGGEDIVSPIRPNRRDSKATTSPDPCTHSLLNTLCFSTPFIPVSWAMIQSEKVTSPADEKAPLKSLNIRPRHGDDSLRYQNTIEAYAIFYLFVAALAHVLILTDDAEIHDLGRPLPIHQLRKVIIALKQLLYKASCVDEGNSLSRDEDRTGTREDSNYFGLTLVHASSKTMRDLYDRSSRRPICLPKLWTIDNLMEKELRRCKTHEDYTSLLGEPVLRVCPFLVSFKRRLRLFERVVYTDRVQVQGENNANPFNSNPLKPGIPVRVTRGRILEDGLATMNNLGSEMRSRLNIQYYNEAGARETGVDAGGLFKEFWTDLSAIAFDLNFALFCINEENCMYPNPASGAAHGSDHIRLFEFLGRILGKSLYENITIQPQFAHFFLSFLRGDYNYMHMFADLSTMDSQLYNNLMFLKTYDGNAEDLCLSFTVAVDDFGGAREIALVPNGANMEVTNANKHRYIGLVTKYYVVDRVKEQSEAFTRGLWEVIDKSWLRIFNEPELQVLISGATDGKIDVDDLRVHTRYAGGFTGIDRTVHRFWSVLSSMTSKQQADLLRFVTSCERPPPLGFSTLTPPFTIQRVGILRDGDKLPASSTCFNTLKLPTYSSEKVMKERLLYAIESGAGFELT